MASSVSFITSGESKVDRFGFEAFGVLKIV
jgi:hypothetical protein